jgi:hypothetical protein
VEKEISQTVLHPMPEAQGQSSVASPKFLKPSFDFAKESWVFGKKRYVLNIPHDSG